MGLLTAGAATITRVFIGFLFGVPKFVSSGTARARGELGAQPAPAAGAEPTGATWSPSTNLAEISDWLTKLLLGAGLVQLTSLGAPTRTLVHGIADGMGSGADNGEPAAAAVVVAGSVLVLLFALGFIMGYMLTTLWYSHVLAGDQSDQPVPAVAERRHSQRRRPTSIRIGQRRSRSPRRAARTR